MTTLIDLKRLTHARYSPHHASVIPTDEELAKSFLDYIRTSGTDQQKSLADQILDAMRYPKPESKSPTDET